MSTTDNTLFLQTPPSILFRVLHDDNTGLDHEGNLPVRDPFVPITAVSLDNHLSHAIPLVLHLPEGEELHHIPPRERHKAITLIAIDSSAMRNVIDAYAVAKSLGYRNDHADERCQLRNHRDEYLVYGGYDADSYKLLLAITGLEAEVPELTRGNSCSILYFCMSAMSVLVKETAEGIELEIYGLTGVRDPRLVERVALAMGGEARRPRNVESASLAAMLMSMNLDPTPWLE
ncbi:hypothetical protein MMC30_003405 [Trapelia coarctata]|nr:hypothetical protein [Trapelia coarctata]